MLENFDNIALKPNSINELIDAIEMKRYKHQSSIDFERFSETFYGYNNNSDKTPLENMVSAFKKLKKDKEFKKINNVKFLYMIFLSYLSEFILIARQLRRKKFSFILQKINKIRLQ